MPLMLGRLFDLNWIYFDKKSMLLNKSRNQLKVFKKFQLSFYFLKIWAMKCVHWIPISSAITIVSSWPQAPPPNIYAPISRSTHTPLVLRPENKPDRLIWVWFHLVKLIDLLVFRRSSMVDKMIWRIRSSYFVRKMRRLVWWRGLGWLNIGVLFRSRLRWVKQCRLDLKIETTS